jgi:hypothetical protein
MKCPGARLTVLALSILLVSACTTTAVREYQSPALSGGQTALIESGPYTLIEGIDGGGLGSLRASVPPGRHTIAMRPDEQNQPLRDYLFYSWVTGSVDFTAEAGHRYLVYVDFTPEPGQADERKGSGFVWTGYVLDRSTGMKIANTGPLPLGAEPRRFPNGSPIDGVITGGTVRTR